MRASSAGMRLTGSRASGRHGLGAPVLGARSVLRKGSRQVSGGGTHTQSGLGLDYWLRRCEGSRFTAQGVASVTCAGFALERARSRPMSRISRMARYLHTMVRVTDPDRSRRFYEALGMEFRRDLD